VKAGQHREDNRVGKIQPYHQALGVRAIHPGPDEEPKEKAGRPGRSRGQAQVHPRASPVCEKRIERDRAAVEAALSREESNGQTEGQITNLKFIKRSMYGRGSFALLHQRVLHAA
jgi:hypothetical protein